MWWFNPGVREVKWLSQRHRASAKAKLGIDSLSWLPLSASSTAIYKKYYLIRLNKECWIKILKSCKKETHNCLHSALVTHISSHLPLFITYPTVMTLHSTNPNQVIHPNINLLGFVFVIVLVWGLFFICLCFLEYMVTEIPGFKSQLSHWIDCCNIPKPRAEFLAMKYKSLWPKLPHN